MYGEDSSGRKVSLLNDDTSTSRTTSSPTSTCTSTFTRPKLPDRSRFSNSASSTCSSRSRESNTSNRSSRPSSISCSPRPSPPTPPLVRLDSQSSLSSPSPMTPPFSYDPMDHRNVYKNGQNAQQGFYVNHYPPPHPASGQQHPYPPMPEGAPPPFYPMSAQQALPTTYDLNEQFSQQATLNPLQTASLSHYTPNPALGQLSPPHNSSILPSPSTILPATVANKANNRPPSVSTPAAPSANASSFGGSTMSPIKTDPSTPITSSKSSAKPSNNNATQPKKKYPCPHAKQAGCKDTFTTSGHAARHGKKHTGEKNVACPTCGKTFTRKDNMKQHERTHKNQAAGAIARATPDNLNTSSVLAANSLGRRGRTVSSSTLGSVASTKDFDSSEVNMMDTDMDGPLHPSSRPEMRRSKLSEILEQVKHDGELDAEGELDPDADGESPALDALATVAAGEIVQ